MWQVQHAGAIKLVQQLTRCMYAHIREEHITEEAQAKSTAAEAEEELSAVRAKAGARLKELIGQNKGLEEQVAELREVAELNQSKMRSLERSLTVADDKHAESTKQLAQDYTYARAQISFTRSPDGP